MNKRQLFKLGWRGVKRSIEWVFYWIFDSAVLVSQRPKPDTNITAIVHIKLLGDYVLWWPYAIDLIRYLHNKRQDVVLVVNRALLPLVTLHFPECRVIGIDCRGFKQNLRIRAKSLRELRQSGVGHTYHTAYPRDALIEDASVRALAAPAWGFDVVFTDRPWFDRAVSDRLYSKLLPPMPTTHQAARYQALHLEIGVPRDDGATVGNFSVNLALNVPSPYFVVVPGASHAGKLWPVERFAQIATKILRTKSNWYCVVLGTEKERYLGEMLRNLVEGKVDNRAGQTSLTDFVRWVSQAQLVVGNDSAACHIAAACGVKSATVVGGGHYGWFFPYDASEARVKCFPITVSEPMACFGCDWVCCYSVGPSQPYPCIASVKTEQMWNAVEAAFASLPRVSSNEPDASPHAGI